ncbi:MAG: DNA replication terminus site-binding protein [Oleibacter sp.]|nr:DNA replication terminus site-binding protein [Thalassolituus sp.]
MISELKTSFADLCSALQALRNHLLSERPSCHFPLTDSEKQRQPDPLFWLTELLVDVWYRDGQDGRETRSRHGVINATAQTQELLHAVNDCKRVFADQVRAIRKTSDEQWLELAGELASGQSSFRSTMTITGLSRVHLKQCARRLSLLEQRPARVGFSWYNHGRSIKRVTATQAQDLLLALGEEKDHIQVQLKILGNLRPNTALAQVQMLAAVVRANLVFESGRKATNSPLPLFIPAEYPQQELPVIKDVDIQPLQGRQRKARNDDQLSDVALLPSIRVFTYSEDG